MQEETQSVKILSPYIEAENSINTILMTSEDEKLLTEIRQEESDQESSKRAE